MTLTTAALLSMGTLSILRQGAGRSKIWTFNRAFCEERSLQFLYIDLKEDPHWKHQQIERVRGVRGVRGDGGVGGVKWVKGVEGADVAAIYILIWLEHHWE